MNERWQERWAGAAVLLGAACFGVAAPGCAIGELAGAMAESSRRQGSTTIEAEYSGLTGKSFAVVVMADRVIQADHAAVVARLTRDIADRLAKFAGGSAFVPGEDVLRYTFNYPRWSTMPPSELARALGVERLVVVELTEYRLNDPGNQYLWQGVAAGSVSVYEAESVVPDEQAYHKALQVKFPDRGGYGPADLPRAAVNTELSRRFIDRASWLFYRHDEKNIIEY